MVVHAVTGRAAECGSPTNQVSGKVRSPPRALMASMGNNRANAISENEPNYEPDCERDCEVQHNVNLTPDPEDSFLAPARRPLRFKDYPSNV
jgi:hypothetical protein